MAREHRMKPALDRYRLLGRSGLRVSPLCLGTMTFGTEWRFGAEKEQSRRVFDLYADRGGNFVDTANFYTDGTSEEYLGEFLEGKRDRMVVATKYTLNPWEGDPNGGGSHRKSLVRNLEQSLRRLRTDHIDLYYVHIWEPRTPMEEVMRALDDAVRAGKVLYAGISDAPSWVVARMNTLAQGHGWTPFTALQLPYSLVQRDIERELVPMARHMGLGITPWGVLSSGLLSDKYVGLDPEEVEEKQLSERRSIPKKIREPGNRRMLEAAAKVAEQLNATVSQVAWAWVLSRPGVVSPIMGARTAEQLEENLAALELELSEEQQELLEEASDFEPGVPADFLRNEAMQRNVTGGAEIEPRPGAWDGESR